MGKGKHQSPATTTETVVKEVVTTEETVTTTETSETTSTIEQILKPVDKIKAEVKVRVHEETNKAVVNALVDAELGKRKVGVLSGIEKLETLQKELKAMKPDNSTFNADGVETISYSKPTFEKRKQLVQKIEKLENALNDALSKGDYQKLNQVLGGKDEPSKKEDASN